MDGMVPDDMRRRKVVGSPPTIPNNIHRISVDGRRSARAKWSTENCSDFLQYAWFWFTMPLPTPNGQICANGKTYWAEFRTAATSIRNERPLGGAISKCITESTATLMIKSPVNVDLI